MKKSDCAIGRISNLVILLLILCLATKTEGQINDLLTNGIGLSNTGIFGQNSVLTGMKNVLGGVVTADNIHNGCMQKVMKILEV